MGGTLSILNNIPSLMAENQMSVTEQGLNKTLQQLSSGSRINSGADDPAGLAIADGLSANVTALTQSDFNANDGVGQLQVTDGALSQVTTLLNRAVTLATESANGTLSSTQRTAIDTEFTVHQVGNRLHRIVNNLQRSERIHGNLDVDLHERRQRCRRQRHRRHHPGRTFFVQHRTEPPLTLPLMTSQHPAVQPPPLQTSIPPSLPLPR